MTNFPVEESPGCSAEKSEADKLQELYLSVFTPPENQGAEMPYFKQVSILDYSLKSYTTDSTLTTE